MNEKIKLSSTSALVLLWAENKFYESSLARKYLDLMDLNSGQKLLEECNKFCSYYDQVIKNRKNTIRFLVRNFLNSNDETQIVILGCGLDPLSLEITSDYKNVPIFEIDRENLEIKSKIINQILPNHKIHFINEDLQNIQSLKTLLIMNGFDFNKKTLIIAEGISYYISENSLFTIFNIFSNKNHYNQIIMEYLKPDNLIDTQVINIPQNIFNLIKNTTSLNDIIRYDTTKIKSYGKNIPLQIIQTYSMTKMEKLRLQYNQYFPTNKDGWIEISLITL